MRLPICRASDVGSDCWTRFWKELKWILAWTHCVNICCAEAYVNWCHWRYLDTDWRLLCNRRGQKMLLLGSWARVTNLAKWTMQQSITRHSAATFISRPKNCKWWPQSKLQTIGFIWTTSRCGGRMCQSLWRTGHNVASLGAWWMSWRKASSPTPQQFR